MTMSLAFWVIMLIYLVYHGVRAYQSKDVAAWSLLPIVLIALLGWRVFGPPIQG